MVGITPECVIDPWLNRISVIQLTHNYAYLWKSPKSISNSSSEKSSSSDSKPSLSSFLLVIVVTVALIFFAFAFLVLFAFVCFVFVSAAFGSLATAVRTSVLVFASLPSPWSPTSPSTGLCSEVIACVADVVEDACRRWEIFVHYQSKALFGGFGQYIAFSAHVPRDWRLVFHACHHLEKNFRGLQLSSRNFPELNLPLKPFPERRKHRLMRSRN